MSENGYERDPLLQNLFAEAQREFDGEEFSARVVARTRSLAWLAIAGCGVLVLGVALAAWLLAVPYEVARVVAEMLTFPIIPLEEGWVAWALSPVNNIGGFLVILARGLHMLQKRARR